jgi:hypothetical protein
MVLDVIVTSQVERLAHALNVPLRKERADVHLKARSFRHCASQALRVVLVDVPHMLRSAATPGKSFWGKHGIVGAIENVTIGPSAHPPTLANFQRFCASNRDGCEKTHLLKGAAS